MSAARISPEEFAAAVAMSDEELRGFLAGRWLCKLALVRQDGTPAVSPVWYLFDGAFWISTFAHSFKARAVRRAGQAALCVDTDVPLYKAVLVRGRAEVVTRDAIEVSRRIYERYLGPEKGPAHLQEVIDVGEDEIVLVRVEAEHVSSWNYERDPVYKVR